MKHIFTILIILFSCVLWAGTLTITTFDHDGDGSASGIGADIFVDENSPNNPGGSDAIKVRTNTVAQHIQVTYMRFDLSFVNDLNVTDAKLKLYDYRFDESPAQNRQYSIYGMTNSSLDNWGETAISWNNAPGITDDGIAFNGVDFNSDALHLGTFTFINSDQAGFSTDISLSGLANFINNDDNRFVTLMMAHVEDGRDTLFYFGSKESNHYSRTSSTTVAIGSLAPQLILQGEDVRFIPEPVSLIFLILGILLYFSKNKYK